MIEAKFKYKGRVEWDYRDFNSEEDLKKFVDENKEVIENYDSRKKKNPIKEWWYNITHIRKNYKKVQSSPYASLLFALKVRKLVIGILIPYLIYMCVKMVINYNGHGLMQTFGRAVTIAIFIYLVYRIWKTIPQAKKQIEYYKKYPHTINYCPTNVKEDVDDIINKIKNNKAAKEEKENGIISKK